MNYSSKYSDEFLREFIDHYGEENIPNPEHYPMRFKFMVKSFEQYKKMRSIKNE